MSSEQTQQADDPSGDGWAWVAKGDTVREGDMWRSGACSWCTAERVGETVQYNAQYRRRIEQPQSKPEANPDDPSEPGWRDAEVGDSVCEGDMWNNYPPEWHTTESIGQHRGRIEPQPSDSEPETMDDLRRRLAECEVLLAEAERSGEQVNAELQQLREQVRDLTRQTQVDALQLQQLREQVQALTAERDEHARKLEFARESGEMSRRELECETGKIEQLKQQLRDAVEARQKAERELATETKCYRDSFKANHKAGQQQVLEELQSWLRPVLELVAEHPDDCGPLAVSVLGYLPGIASRLIEE